MKLCSMWWWSHACGVCKTFQFYAQFVGIKCNCRGLLDLMKCVVLYGRENRFKASINVKATIIAEYRL